MIKPANTPVTKGVRLSEGINVTEYKIKDGKGFSPTYKFAINKARGKGEYLPSKTERVK